MTFRDQPTRQRTAIPEARQVNGLAVTRIVDELSTGRRKKDQGPFDIRTRRKFSGAVIHVEAGRHVTCNLAGQDRVPEPRGEFQRVVDRRHHKASTAHCHGGGSHSRGANHIDGDDCVAPAVAESAFRERIHHPLLRLEIKPRRFFSAGDRNGSRA